MPNFSRTLCEFMLRRDTLLALGGRAAPAETKAAVAAALPFALDKEGPTSCESRLCHGTVLCHLRRPTFPSRLYVCYSGGAVPVICSGPRPSFTNGHCDIGFCRSTPTLRLQKAELHQQALRLCVSGAGCPLFSGPGEPSSTEKHCNIKLCRGPLLCDSRKPRVQTRLCDLTRWTSNATPSWIGNVSPPDPVDSAKCEGASQLLREHERIENDESWRPSPSLTANASGWKRDFRAKEPFGVGLRKRNVVHGVAEGDRTSGTSVTNCPSDL